MGRCGNRSCRKHAQTDATSVALQVQRGTLRHAWSDANAGYDNDRPATVRLSSPMTGRNYNGKIFEIAHAKQLVEWAKSKKIGHLAFWSLGTAAHTASHLIRVDIRPRQRQVPGRRHFTRMFEHCSRRSRIQQDIPGRCHCLW